MTCPTCRRQAPFEGNPYRPFCSERCKLIDLGKWASGAYRVPAENRSPEEEDALEHLNPPEDGDDGR